jgi:curved DNA-binding protein CbpA
LYRCKIFLGTGVKNGIFCANKRKFCAKIKATMDTPENYYAILGIPINADTDTLKRAYRQLARRYHPDLAGPEGAVEMKRINRAYAVLSDPEKRHNYDTIISGVIDLRRGGFARLRPQPHTFTPEEDVSFSGLNIFSTKGPFRAGTTIHSSLGVISSLNSIRTMQGTQIAAGSLDGKGLIWQVADGPNDTLATPTSFSADPKFTVESLRELRFSPAGRLIAGWGQLGLHVWDVHTGALLWSYALSKRAVSAHYSIDLVVHVTATGERSVRLALPHLAEDTRAPRAWGVRATDVVSHILGTPDEHLGELQTCTEEEIGKRQFWAIRLRALAFDTQTLITLSCANVPHETQQMIVVRRWDLAARTRLGRARPAISVSVLADRCSDCSPPYAVTTDGRFVAFVHEGHKIRLCDTETGTYSELGSGTMGGSSKIALSSDGQWAAIAREDSELNEGVIDLWSVGTGQVIQKLYHPWQVSALHFAQKQLLVALTDGTIQVWEK